MSIPLLPLLLLGLNSGASPPCSVSDRPTVLDLAALPAWARRQLPSRMAGRDQPFNPSDVMRPNGPPQARLVCAYRSGNAWTVEFEHGGIGLFRKTVRCARRKSPEGKFPARSVHRA